MQIVGFSMRRLKCVSGVSIQINHFEMTKQSTKRYERSPNKHGTLKWPVQSKLLFVCLFELMFHGRPNQQLWSC